MRWPVRRPRFTPPRSCAPSKGAVALTVCVEGSPGECDREHFCTVRGPWQRINKAVFEALAGVTLAELAGETAPARLVQLGGAPGSPADAGARHPGRRQPGSRIESQ